MFKRRVTGRREGRRNAHIVAYSTHRYEISGEGGICEDLGQRNHNHNILFEKTTILIKNSLFFF